MVAVGRGAGEDAGDVNVPREMKASPEGKKETRRVFMNGLKAKSTWFGIIMGLREMRGHVFQDRRLSGSLIKTTNKGRVTIPEDGMQVLM